MFYGGEFEVLQATGGEGRRRGREEGGRVWYWVVVSEGREGGKEGLWWGGREGRRGIPREGRK